MTPIGGMSMGISADQASTVREVALRSVAIMTSGGRSDFDEVIAPDAVNHEAGTEPMPCRQPGPAGFHATADWLRSAFSDLHYEIEHIAIDGNIAVIDATLSGRQTGPFVLYDTAGRIDSVQAPTGRSFTVRQNHWFRIADGQIAEHWAVRDDLRQGIQLGWVPPSPLHLIRSAQAKRRALHTE